MSGGAGPGGARGSHRHRLAAVLVVGLGLRVALAAAAPRWGYAWDHFEVLGMGAVAVERGLARAYSADPAALPVLQGWVPRDGRQVRIERRGVYPPNYPPIAETIFWAQSRWLGAGDPDFVANTVTTRLVTSLAPWIFELVTAIGVGLLARALTGDARLGAAAGVVTWMAPPLMLNTGLFGQYDALALAPAAFALLALVRGRWAAAGVAVGLGVLGKPQGLLMLPVAAFAAAVAAPRELAAAARRAARLAAAALVTVLAGSAPWMLADGFAWLRRCYRMNLFEVLPYTTLEAFNVWYLLGLVAERQPAHDVLSSTVTVAGLTRDAWGRLFLAAALVATAVLAWRRRRRPALAIVLFAVLWLWAAFVWPTRVHERYLLYVVPPLVAAAAAVPRLRPVAAVVLLVGTMEHSWMIWRTGPALGSFDRRVVERLHVQRVETYWRGRAMTMEHARAAPKLEESTALAFDRHRAARASAARLEWALTVLSLGAYAAAVAMVWRAPMAPAARPSDDDAPDSVLASA